MPPSESDAAQTVSMTIQMPLRYAEQIRARVRSGEFASESELVVHELFETDDWDMLPEEPFGREFTRDLIAQRLAKIDSGAENCVLLEDAFARLEDQIRPLRKQL